MLNTEANLMLFFFADAGGSVDFSELDINFNRRYSNNAKNKD